jgi:hypothetical protein
MTSRSFSDMKATNTASLRNGDFSRLASLLVTVPSGLRGPLLMSVVSFRPNENLDGSFVVGDYRAAFAEYWEARFKSAVPVTALRSALDPPIPIRTAIEFNKFALTRDAPDIDAYLATLVQYLADVGKVERYLF